MRHWIFRDLTPKVVIELPDSSAKPGQVAHAPLCVRRKQTHFIDAHKLGTLIDSVHRGLTDEGLTKITSTYHPRRGDDLTRSREVREAKAS